MHPAVHAVFGVFVDRYAYLGALYLLLAFPLGILYFCFLTVGVSLGLGLALLWIGILVLLGVLVAGFGLTAFERQQARYLLGAQVGPMWSVRPASDAGPWDRLKCFLANPLTWKGLVFQLLKFPLGIAGFVFLVTASSISLSLLAAPFLFRIANYDFYWFYVDSLPVALGVSLLGFLGLLLSLHLLRAFGTLWRMLAEWLLSHPQPDA